VSNAKITLLNYKKRT